MGEQNTTKALGTNTVQSSAPGTKNVLRKKITKIVLPTLHMKLGMMKQFFKALDKGSDGFQQLYQKFLGFSVAEIKGY